MAGGMCGRGACVTGGCVWKGGRGACVAGAACVLQQILWDTVNERAVGILLECILALLTFLLH